ncbi:MAG: aminotransferase class I/II-fold pyridoxal phosphate-dependent enzyme [Chloroflexi bacterium]|nr:aminotransferase class I/II-fold pyridoxal phosphate-dependent enzyme [Chloroflexota bacterium]
MNEKEQPEHLRLSAEEMRSFGYGVVYYSDQTHSSVERGLRLLGFAPAQLRKLPSDDGYRLPVARIRAAIAADRAAGLQPFCVVANAGTTNTGAVDPLPELVELCGLEGLWLHADSAYGGAAVLSDRGRRLLQGLGDVDSLAVDPHKWLFQPYACGCVLFRDVRQARDTFHILPEYLQDVHRAAEEINFCDYGVELTRPFRALKLWLSLQVFGLDAFRAALERGLAQAELTEAILRGYPDWEIVTPAQLAILTFRYAPPGRTDAELDVLNLALVDRLIATGYAMISSTVLRGRPALRVCTINPRTTEDDLHGLISLLDWLART